MQLKGLAISSALQMVLVVLVGGTVMAVVGGPMLGQIEDGFNVLGDMTTSTTLNISNKATFSDAAMYVYDRASNDGCNHPDNAENAKKPTVPAQIDPDIDLSSDQNEPNRPDAKYPDLQGTFLGQEPPCIATDDATGADMEGKASRVEFVIDETRNSPITLGDGNEWIDSRVVGARNADFYEATQGECNRDIIGTAANGAVAGAVVGSGGGNLLGGVLGGTVGFVGGAAYSAINGARFVGVGQDFIVYFRANVNDRTGEWLTESEDIVDDRIYCYAFKQQVGNADFMDAELLESPLDSATEDLGDTSVTLCPGDRGYIQMNKEEPQNDGEAGEGWGGNAHNFPFIQITEAGDCS